ncbi:unnamed protein product [Brassica oleracea]
MNIAMGQTEEYVNGQLKNKYGDAFIRGNNGNQNLPSCILLLRSAVYEYKFSVFSFGAVLCISTVNRPLADGA